jgi:hypothetical protein
MKKILILLLLSFSLMLPVAAGAAAPVEVDVLYMNHGPLQPTLDKLKALFAGYNEKITPRWHDFESPDGEKFMAAKGIRRHIPLMIWINGKETVQVEGVAWTFSGFPSGLGPQMFQGKWTLETLTKALDQATGQH